MLATLVLGMSLWLDAPAHADPPESPTPEQAQALFEAGAWAQAAEALEALVGVDETDGATWFRLAFALYKINAIPEASAAWQRALDLDFYPMVSAYNVAASRALLGDVEGAITYLERAVALGFSDPELMRTDSDFASVRQHARFASLIEQAERNARPCMYDARFRAFDFWVGDWVVRDASGQKVGSDRVKQAENGCAITAQWTDQFGRTGTSLTYFDPARDLWVQTRVGAGGHFVQAEGRLERSGAMILAGDLTLANGDSRQVRTIWTPRSDGTLRMKVERSDDGGRTWTPSFEGLYERRSMYGRD